MSGLAAVWGSGASGELVREMLGAARHRGDVVDVAIGDGFAVGVQQREGVGPFFEAGILREGSCLVAISGSVFEGSEALGGADGAKRVLDALDRGGVDALRELSGAFACVIFRDGQLLAARSFPGERPLFWARAQGKMVLASEVKQIVAALPDLEIDEEALVDCAMGNRDERTSYKQVSRLMPGTLSASSLSEVPIVSRCKVPDLLSASLSLDEVVEGFKFHFEQAVARRADPNTAVMMSAGLDSPPVALVTTRINQQRGWRSPHIISGSFPDYPSSDETGAIQDVARSAGLEVDFMNPPIRAVDLAADARLHDGMCWCNPGTEVVRALYRRGRSSGANVLMTGDDGSIPFQTRPGYMRELLRTDPKTLWRYLRHWHGLYRTLRLMIFMALPRFIQQGLISTLNRGNNIELGDLRDCLRSDLHKLAFTLEYFDRFTLGEGLNLAMPLNDCDLLRFALRLPTRQLYQNGLTKSPIRQIYPELGERWRTQFRGQNFNEAYASLEAPSEAPNDWPRRWGERWNQAGQREQKWALIACYGWSLGERGLHCDV